MVKLLINGHFKYVLSVFMRSANTDLLILLGAIVWEAWGEEDSQHLVMCVCWPLVVKLYVAVT